MIGNRVLIVATSRKTRGGITSVLRSYQTGAQWKQYHCFWVESHIDRGLAAKLWKLFVGLLQYLILLPFAKMVHIHLSDPTSAGRKLLFFVPARCLRKKIILHFHTASIDEKHLRLYQYLFSGADRIIVMSNLTGEFIRQKFQICEKVRTIYNPCIQVPDIQPSDRQPSILFAGTLCRRKSPGDLIKAFSRIEKRYPEWYLTFAGNGEIEEARALAESLGIGHRCYFLGWVSGAERDKAFREASIFCLPSYEEGFPMSVLDAWGYGLPVVTTPVGGIVDFARDGENVLLCHPGDIEGLSRCLEKLMSDESLRSSLSGEAQRLTSEMFDPQVINRQIEALYKEVLG